MYESAEQSLAWTRLDRSGLKGLAGNQKKLELNTGVGMAGRRIAAAWLASGRRRKIVRSNFDEALAGVA